MRDKLQRPADLISLSEATEAFGVSPATLYRSLKRGRLQRFRGGLGDRKTYLSRQEVRRLAECAPVGYGSVVSQMAGELVSEGRWPSIASERLKGDLAQDPVLAALPGREYGVARQADGRWSVNWFEEDGRLAAWFGGAPNFVLRILERYSGLTEALSGEPMPRPWLSTGLARRQGPPTLAALRESRDRILDVAAAHGASNIRVFGSVAKGTANDESDIDLIVDMDPHTGGLSFVGLMVDLQEALGRTVHVVETTPPREPLLEHVLKDAIPL